MRYYVSILVLVIAAWSVRGDGPPAKLPAGTMPASPTIPVAPPMPELREPMAFKDITPHEKHHEDHAHPHLDSGHGHEPENVFFNLEYVLLRPRRGALDFAISDGNRDLVPSGKVQSLGYELRSGVRAGVAARIGDSAWFGDFTYTYFRSGADRSITAPAGGTLYATTTRPGLNDEANFAAATASLEYNVFDATVGRWISIDDHASLRVFGGLRCASVSNKFDVRYDGQDANLGLVKTGTSFDGFGPLIGGEVTAKIHGGYHVFGRGNASLLTGQFRNPIMETNNAGLTTYADLDYSSRRVIPVVGLAVGGGWQHNNVTIRAGYEITNWFGFIDSPRLSGELSEGKFTTRRSDLSLEGFFVQLGVAY